MQVGRYFCQVQGTQPVPIRYQIREVSRGRRTRVTLPFSLPVVPKRWPSSFSCQVSRSPVSCSRLSVVADGWWILAEVLFAFQMNESKRHGDRYSMWQRWRSCIIFQLPSSAQGEEVALGLTMCLWTVSVYTVVLVLQWNAATLNKYTKYAQR